MVMHDLDLYEDVAFHLNIHGNNILDPCESFPQGLKVGDRIKSMGYNDDVANSTIINKGEWDANSDGERIGEFTNNDGVCARDDTPYHGRLYWRNGWEDVRFLERPMPIEDDGQLLMF